MYFSSQIYIDMNSPTASVLAIKFFLNLVFNKIRIRLEIQEEKLDYFVINHNQ